MIIKKTSTCILRAKSGIVQIWMMIWPYIYVAIVLTNISVFSQPQMFKVKEDKTLECGNSKRYIYVRTITLVASALWERNHIFFADDSNVLISGTNFKQILKIMNDELVKNHTVVKK